MNKSTTILGIAGSLRRESYNRSALRAATRLVPEGATIEVFELDGIPGFNQDEEQNPPAKVAELKKKIRESDAILFVTPEYNYSVPGVLKNAIDWASRPYGESAWNGKPAAIMGASIGSIGTARAQYHLRQMFMFLNIFPINQPEVMIGNAGERFDAQGNLTDETTKDLIRQLLQNLVDWTRRLQQLQEMEKTSRYQCLEKGGDMKKTTSESRFSALVLAAVIAFGVVACVAWGKPQQAAERGFAWKDGAEVYEKVCAFCHETKIGPTIRGRGLDPIYVGFMVRNGLRAMPAFREAEIDDQSLQKLAEYVSDDKQVRDGDPARGRAIVASGVHGCTACHTIPGIQASRGVVGPPLGGMARRSFIAGQLPNKPDVLVAFLQDPPAFVPETGMPDVRVSLEEARHIAAFLYTLEPARDP